MLFVDIQESQSLKIGDVIIKLVYKSGKRARLQIDADPSVKVQRLDEQGREQKESK